MARFINSILTAGAILFLSACKDTPSKSHGPIILGDSSTIVTERDPQKLEDLVTELHPVIPPPDTVSAPKDTVALAHPDSVKKLASAVVAALPDLSGNGLKADFKVTAVLISNVNAKQSGNPNLEHAGGAVYTLISGSINGNTLKVTGNIIKVSQRYQTIVVLKDNGVNLPVESLSTTTGWQPLKGSNNIYPIAGLDAPSLEYADDGPAAIRNAVSKMAKRRRMSRKKTEELLNGLRNVRKANQKPLYVVLRSVMWKIDGKDEKGRAFSKQIRIDVPM
jgi:hypothetical protein